MSSQFIAGRNYSSMGPVRRNEYITNHTAIGQEMITSFASGFLVDTLMQTFNDVVTTENPELRFQKTIQTVRILVSQYLTIVCTYSPSDEKKAKDVNDLILKLLKELEECVTAPAKFYPDAAVKHIDLQLAQQEFERLREENKKQ